MPQAGPPFGGGDTVARGSRGGDIPIPYVGSSQMAPPILGLDYAHSQGARSHFLPIFTGNLGESLDRHFIGSIILQVHVVDSSSGFC